METASHLLLRDSHLREPAEEEMLSPGKREYQRVLAEKLGAADLATHKVLAFQTKPAAAPEGHSNNLKIIYR
jgi:hypothetical protein